MTSTDSITINGYDLRAENGRLAFEDVVVCGHRLNRGTAVVAHEGLRHPDYGATRAAHRSQVFPNTVGAESPVLDLSYPTAGMFASSPAGVYIDAYQGVAQKLVDERHPRFRAAIDALVRHGLAFRREINTDDYLMTSTPMDGVHTPQELAALINGLCAERFPTGAPYRTFFSNSGAEAGEAAIKLAQLHAYHRVVGRYGHELYARVMADLGIARDHRFDAEPTKIADPLYTDYPFFLIGCESAFHGRTLGVLNLTGSKKVQLLGYSKLRWVRHIAFNGDQRQLAELLDPRPLPELLEAPGGVAGVIAAGRVPADLAALFALEVYQGEGGYRIADRQWLGAVAATCREHDVLLGVDEVQSFGRTGALFALERYDVEPDVLWASKGAVVGFTVARGALADECPIGWHSNTFGGGKIFDVCMAYATIDTLVNHHDPLFEGRTYLENARIKGEYMRNRLANLQANHPELFLDFSGFGGMWGLSVRYREEIVETGWRRGIKLLGCGWAGEVSRLRVILLADVLTREVDQLVDVLDRVFDEVERRHADEL